MLARLIPETHLSHGSLQTNNSNNSQLMDHTGHENTVKLEPRASTTQPQVI